MGPHRASRESYSEILFDRSCVAPVFEVPTSRQRAAGHKQREKQSGSSPKGPFGQIFIYSLRNTPACRSGRHAGRRRKIWDLADHTSTLHVRQRVTEIWAFMSLPSSALPGNSMCLVSNRFFTEIPNRVPRKPTKSIGTWVSTSNTV